MSKDSEQYNLNPCIKCGGSNLEADSTGCLEIYGVCYQSGWVLCNDCGHEVAVSFNDSKNTLFEWKDMLDVWNAGVDYDGEIEYEL